MMIYAWIGSLVAALAAGAYGGYQWESGRWAQEEAKRLKVEAELQQKDAALKQEQANHEQDMATVAEVERAKVRIIYRDKYQTAQQSVATHTEFVTAPCVMDAASLQYLNAARASLRLPAGSLESDAGMRSPIGPPTGREVHDPVPATVPRPASDSGVSGPPQPTSGGNQGPGESLRPPKPVPRAKQ